MSDSLSTRSCGITIPSIASNASLNPLNTMNTMILSKIKKQIDVYIGVSAKCRQIWNSLQKNQIAGSRLSEKVIQIVFKQFETDLYNYTRVTSLKEFMKLFDVDHDGFLNEDEQVSIFSYIKQRVQLTANNALVIQSYLNFKALMKQARELQRLISNWQDNLRQNIHKQQLLKYQQIGQSRIDQFCIKYDQFFNEFLQSKIERKDTFQQQCLYQMNDLNQKLMGQAQYMRIKPKNKVKLYQMQQKLVALQERVDQAMDFRKQLNDLQIEEKQRVDRMKQEKANNQRQNLRRIQDKHRRQLDFKLNQLQNKLIIRMKRQYDVLLKKNSLHQNEIKRLQNIMAKWAIEKGTFQPELRRTKTLQRKRNQIIGNHKNVKKLKPILSFEQDDENTSNSKMTSKTLLSRTTNFSISKKELEDVPVNTTSILNSKTYDGKISKFLQPKKSLSSISLCQLYDDNLKNLYQVAPAQNQLLYKAQVWRKRKFILSKMI